jgi:DNA-binding response OmpR family regulator
MHHLLLVEDEAALCLLLAEVLRDEGFEVTEALTPDEAEQALSEQLARPLAALVTDINVRRRGWGYDFAERARAAAPTLAVVYMTGDSEAASSHRGVPDSRLLPKPFAPMELVRVVRSLVAADGGAAAPQSE